MFIEEHRLLAMQKSRRSKSITANSPTPRPRELPGSEIEEHHRQQIEAVTAQHTARTRHLEKHNTELIEAATRRAARIHELERVVQAVEVRAGELERGLRHNSERNKG
jgi:hypothetical protein